MIKLHYAPWMYGPQQPWESFDNPDYVSLMQGRSTIELQPRVDPTAPPGYGQDPLARPSANGTTVTLVPEEAYLKEDDEDDEVPTQENGTLSLCKIGSTAAVSRRSHRLTKSLVTYITVPAIDAEIALATADPTKPSPLAVPPVQVNDQAAPIGGCISVTKFSYGHLGTQFNVIYDVPAGVSVRAPAGASFTQNDGVLVPKYYNFRTDAATNIRIYTLTAGGPDLTNLRWNNLDQSVLPANNPTGDLSVSNPNAVAYSGWSANTAAYTNTNFSMPKRRFYGSIFTDSGDPLPNPWGLPAASAGEIVQCPMANFATQVTLVANAALNFVFIGPTSAGGVTEITGPFPVNVAVNIPADAIAIWVYYVVKPIITGKVRVELPFVLVYEISP